MPSSIKGAPKDGLRKLNLRYHVGDPRFLAIEALRDRLEHGQATGVLLAALVIGAERMLERMPAPDPLPNPKGARLSIFEVDPPQLAKQATKSPASPAAHVLSTSQPPGVLATTAPVRKIAVAIPTPAVRYSAGTASQFAAFAEDD